MKTIEGPSVKKVFRVFLLMAVLFIMIICCSAYRNYDVYQSIDVILNEVTSIEYGTEGYDVKELIKEVDGEIISVKQDLDTSVLGAQEIILEIKKNNMVKDVPIIVSVVDTIAPVITLQSDKVSITEGDNYDLSSNLSSVVDAIDGELPYVEDIPENGVHYYRISYDGNINDVGEHTITISAVDGSGNEAISSYVFEVEKRTYRSVYYNLPANPCGGDMVSTAYSLLGMPYTYAGRGPYAFDCSGFVHYVYACAGYHISASSYMQQFEGYPVSYDSIQPGDIIIWGYVDGQPTHSALYVGNGQMIHAANYSQGVILSDVNYWLNGSETHILTVRRIQ